MISCLWEGVPRRVEVLTRKEIIMLRNYRAKIVSNAKKLQGALEIKGYKRLLLKKKCQ
jgi:hypothetical protein